MELQLKNVGMIKEANVKIDGLTVIAGENDTGKSTVGKALFFINEFEELFDNKTPIKDLIAQENKYKEKFEKLKIKLDELNDDENNMDLDNDVNLWVQSKKISTQASSIKNELDTTEKKLKLIDIFKKKSDDEIDETENKMKLNKILKEFQDIFYFDIKDDAQLIIIDEKNYKIGIEENNIITIEKNKLYKNNSVFIETPIVLNLFSHFSKLDTVQNEIEYNVINYPYIMRSLYKKIKLETKSKPYISNLDIKDIINGEIVISESGELLFKREDTLVDIQSTATGIKSFGIIQMLLNNGYLSNGSILILDEPEVHLHPKWQLEMANLIIELVKLGVKVLVTSHSPYMIEALELLAKKNSNSIKSNFYLATKENNFANITELKNDLTPIYNLLSQPIDTLEKIELDDFKW